MLSPSSAALMEVKCAAEPREEGVAGGSTDKELGEDGVRAEPPE